MPRRFEIGQRWSSETEPELGLGAVKSITDYIVAVDFAATHETRQYALDSAPLRRIRFRPGDQITTRNGTTLRVTGVEERQGLIVYRAGATEIPEAELNDQITLSSPEERLLNGHVDPPAEFDLRWTALQHQHRRRQSKVRGFVGGRVDLIPHQLSIASEVAGRLVPRVLLADEVGLGKTIEACLILHRLIQTGRVQRVLVLVPEPLLHQWFVELLRRFNLWFHIFDEERCDAIETADPDANPFLDDQWVLCAIELLAQSPRRAEQALAAGWDLLVVDEAHHLGWTPEAVSPEYGLVQALGLKIPALLLLTGTPEQLGMASHFARLRLLDPDRYYSLEEFLKESEHYRQVAQIADKLLRRVPLAATEVRTLARILARDEVAITSLLQRIAAGEAKSRQQLIDDLLDQHGTGRVMFRNTRATVTGFPRLIARLYPLPCPETAEPLLERLAAEYAADQDTTASPFQPKLDEDPRMDWLADLLRQVAPAKVLLICRSREKVAAIATTLSSRLNIKTAQFHEGVPLVQRDRNAAWFAEEDGARILIASEIGSEGRNFQFAHHLVLFDLPLDPELLEQRIGRLDRIGQRSEIQVHVPFVAGSPQEVLARWFHEGLDAFARNLRGGRQMLERFGARVHDLAQDFHETRVTAPAALEELITATRAADQELAIALEQGRDHLLELNSFRPDVAAAVTQSIQKQDADRSLDAFMLSVFDHFGIQVEELAERTYCLGSAGVFADTFPGLPTDGLTVTLNRPRALSREDIQFLTWDHPLVTGALDLILGSPKGNSSFAHWPDPKTQALYLEAIYLVECVAPPPLHVDRFLPPTPLRVVVDHHGAEVSSAAPLALLQKHLKPGDPYPLLSRPELCREVLPELIAQAKAFAEQALPPIVADARRAMAAQLNHEIARLRALQKVNSNVHPREVELLVEQQKALVQFLSAARVRLDSIRLIQRGK